MSKKSSTSDLLMAQLSKSMPKEKKEPVSVPAKKQPSEARKTTSTPKKKASPKKPVRKSSTPGQKVINRNTSLYPEDDDKIFEIQGLLRKELGKKCSDSRAIQLALRLVSLKEVDKIIAAFGEISARDGRSTKK